MNSEGKGKGIPKTQRNGYKIMVRKSKTAFSTTWAAVIRKKSFLFFSFLFYFKLQNKSTSISSSPSSKEADDVPRMGIQVSLMRILLGAGLRTL